MINITLGRHSFIREPFENLYETEIDVGNFTSIAGGLRIIDIKHPDCVSNFAFNEDFGCTEYPSNERLGKITIGHDVLIGAYCLLVAGITIGHGVIIKAGSLVSQDIPSYAIMQGNLIIKYRFNREIREALLTSKWWDRTDEEMSIIAKDFIQPALFLDKYLERNQK